MSRIFKSFPIIPGQATLNKFLGWANLHFNKLSFLVSQQPNNDPLKEFDAILAAGSSSELICSENENPFEKLKQFCDQNSDWVFGFLTYDIKNQIENLSSSNFDGIQMPLMHFYIPDVIFIFRNNQVEIGIREGNPLYPHHEIILNEIHRFQCSSTTLNETIKISQRVSPAQYKHNVETIRKHIKNGDIYEANYCIEFFSENVQISPYDCFVNLNQISPAPFAAYYRLNDKYLISSSPERFLAKRGSRIISQPIKGTIRRGKSKGEDEALKLKLKKDPKEWSENVMIVDIVRNDLSHIAAKGSVAVTELCGIYTYPNVHQMISTVQCELDVTFHFTDALRYAFPMGSMTGAPKIRAMELMEKYENTRRGLYSGAVGYISPEGNFDFSVVIRSILYNQTLQYLSYMAGSAITILSDPETEYKECILKAAALKRAINCHKANDEYFVQSE